MQPSKVPGSTPSIAKILRDGILRGPGKPGGKVSIQPQILTHWLAGCLASDLHLEDRGPSVAWVSVWSRRWALGRAQLLRVPH